LKTFTISWCFSIPSSTMRTGSSIAQRHSRPTGF
jgi:hypothetical protein